MRPATIHGRAGARARAVTGPPREGSGSGAARRNAAPPAERDAGAQRDIAHACALTPDSAKWKRYWRASGRYACGRRGVWGQRTWVHASLRGFQRWWNECLHLAFRNQNGCRAQRGHTGGQRAGLSMRSYANIGQTPWLAASATCALHAVRVSAAAGARRNTAKRSQRGQLLECGGGHSGGPTLLSLRT